MRLFLKHIPLVLGLLILVAGCKETPLPSEVIEEPVFFAKGLVGGEPVDLSAGKNDYFLHTEFLQDTSGLYAFRSSLSAPDKAALFIRMNNQTASNPGDPVDPSQVFLESDYPYAAPDSVLRGYTVSFKASAPDGDQFTWRLNRNNRATGAEISRFFPTAEADSFTVELLSVNNQGCRSLLRERVSVPKPDCAVDFEYKPSRRSGKLLEFEVRSNLAPANLTWIFNNQRIRGGRAIAYEFSSRGIFRACVEQDNCKAQTCKNVIAGNAGGCPVNFTYETEEVFKAGLPQPGEITLQWRDENGRFFSTGAKKQPAGSYLRLSSPEAYEANSAGDATRKMQLDIRCWAYNGSDSLLIELDEVSWAFAYPE